MATINITGTGGILEGDLGSANVNVNLDGVLSFDNVSANNDRVVIADDNAATTGDFGTGAFSISFWFYHAEGGFSGDVWGGVITKGYTTSAPSNTWGIVRRASNTSQIVYQQATDAGGGYSDTLYGPTDLEGHGWKHYVITRSGTDTKMYVDGVLFDDNTATETSNLSNSSSLQFGTWNETEDFGPFYLADVKFFTDAITADEVKFLASKIQADPDVGGLDNCVSWWKLNEGTGTNAANSISAGDNGTITGAEWVYDEFSVDVYDNSTTTDGTFTVTQGKVEGLALSSLDFSGDTQLVSCTSNTFYNSKTAFSVSGWFNHDNSHDGHTLHTIVNARNGGNNGMALSLDSTNDRIRLRIGDGSSDDLFTGNSTITNGQWHHVVAMRDGSNNTTIYIDGVSAATGSSSKTISISSGNFGIGGRPSATDADEFSGKIKDVGCWSYDLSAEQVANLILTQTKKLLITNTN